VPKAPAAKKARPAVPGASKARKRGAFAGGDDDSSGSDADDESSSSDDELPLARRAIKK
jgi:hypothetical protein